MDKHTVISKDVKSPKVSQKKKKSVSEKVKGVWEEKSVSDEEESGS